MLLPLPLQGCASLLSSSPALSSVVSLTLAFSTYVGMYGPVLKCPLTNAEAQAIAHRLAERDRLE